MAVKKAVSDRPVPTAKKEHRSFLDTRRQVLEHKLETSFAVIDIALGRKGVLEPSDLEPPPYLGFNDMDSFYLAHCKKFYEFDQFLHPHIYGDRVPTVKKSTLCLEDNLILSKRAKKKICRTRLVG